MAKGDEALEELVHERRADRRTYAPRDSCGQWCARIPGFAGMTIKA